MEAARETGPCTNGLTQPPSTAKLLGRPVRYACFLVSPRFGHDGLCGLLPALGPHRRLQRYSFDRKGMSSAWDEKPVRLRAPCQLPRTPYGEQALRKILRGYHPKLPFGACGRRTGRGGIEGLVTLKDAACMVQADEDDYAESGGTPSQSSGSASASAVPKGKENSGTQAGSPLGAVRTCRSRRSGPPDTTLQEGGAAGTLSLGGSETEAGVGPHTRPSPEPPDKGTTPGRGGWADLLARIRAKEARAKAANEA
jgi:hypothetical protein